MNCDKCAWGTDREACKRCREEQAAKDRPTFAKTTVQSMMADADEFFRGFVALKGVEHVNYIRHRVDEVEYVGPQYGHQN